jgi:phenylalanyl-tRNA synthetase beta subunit
LTFRAQGRTLSNEEVNAARDRLKQQLKAKLAVDFRE